MTIYIECFYSRCILANLVKPNEIEQLTRCGIDYIID